jgi:Zn-dependent protease
MAAELPVPGPCRRCGSELAAALLACPSCGALVHAAALTDLAHRAEALEAAGDLPSALAEWRRALELLPKGTRQAEHIAQKIAALARSVDRAPAPPSAQTRGLGQKGAAGVTGLGLLVWKLKWLLGLLLAQGKLLVLGLTKASTLLSMLLSFGVYWTVWGWRFALGLLVSIYVHEMGHMAQLRRYGMQTSAPMFLPGVGALIRLSQHPVDPREDARIGLAGPLFGLGASLAALALGHLADWPIALAIARTGAWINLFNLLPIGSLDGGRGFRSLSRGERRIAALALFALFVLTKESLLLLLILCAGARAFSAEAPASGDREGLARYIGLAVALAFLAVIRVPGLAGR